MNHGIEATFESIESAHEFVGLLTETTVEAKREIEADVHVSFDRGRIVLSADFFLRSDPQER